MYLEPQNHSVNVVNMAAFREERKGIHLFSWCAKENSESICSAGTILLSDKKGLWMHILIILSLSKYLPRVLLKCPRERRLGGDHLLREPEAGSSVQRSWIVLLAAALLVFFQIIRMNDGIHM